ncbi:MAG: 3-isopropylmalate dehydratase small subunit [Pseudomonadota bacterium]
MRPFTMLESNTTILPATDVDTDQIIPARFLTTTTRDGLGDHLFADWRFDSNGDPNPDFVLNDPETHGSTVLVTGRNFGCGSSREHAPWALLDYGFRAVISSEIADIFLSNSLKNGLLPIRVDQAALDVLLAGPHRVTVDLGHQTLLAFDGPQEVLECRFSIDSFSRYCLMEGIDSMGYLLNQRDAIETYESTRASLTTE